MKLNCLDYIGKLNWVIEGIKMDYNPKGHYSFKEEIKGLVR